VQELPDQQVTGAGPGPAPRWHVLPDAAVLARTVAGRVLTLANASLAREGVFRIVLAGGTTPETVYRRLADAATEWSGWRIYFGDERCLAAEHPGRNSVMAARSWLDRVPVPAGHIHPIPAETGPEAAARAYLEQVREARPFHLVLLGMGEDGHTASLFPGQDHPQSELVHPVHHAPKPPPDRVSLGLAALNDARQVIILVTGKNKQAAVQQWRNGADLPVAGVHGHGGADVYVDVAAWGGSQPEE
jgi:6-phosphogluconolactonase